MPLYTVLLVDTTHRTPLAVSHNMYRQLQTDGRVMNIDLSDNQSEADIRRTINDSFQGPLQGHQWSFRRIVERRLIQWDEMTVPYGRVVPSTFARLQIVTRTTPRRFYISLQEGCPSSCQCNVPVVTPTPPQPLLNAVRRTPGIFNSPSARRIQRTYQANNLSTLVDNILHDIEESDDDEPLPQVGQLRGLQYSNQPTSPLQLRREMRRRLEIEVSIWRRSQSTGPFTNHELPISDLNDVVLPLLKHFASFSFNMLRPLKLSDMNSEVVDAGGLTRELITRFYDQLKTFKIQGVPLLEEIDSSGAYVFALIDDQLPYMYEYVPFALGRLFAYVIIHQLPLPDFLQVEFLAMMIESIDYVSSYALSEMPISEKIMTCFEIVAPSYVVDKFKSCLDRQTVVDALCEYSQLKDISMKKVFFADDEGQDWKVFRDRWVVYELLGQRRLIVQKFLKGMNHSNLLSVLRTRCLGAITTLCSPSPITVETLLSCVTYHREGQFTPLFISKMQLVKAFFIEAIKSMTTEQLTNFVLFATGSKRLPTNRNIEIVFLSNWNESLPIQYGRLPLAHTCSYQVDIFTAFTENEQEAFTESLLVAIGSMAFSSFQMA